MAGADIAAAAGANRHQAVLRGAAHLVEPPLSLVNVSVVVEIGFDEPVRGLVRWCLPARQLSVVILVILCKNRGEVRDLAPFFLIAANFPPVDEYAIPV